MAYRNMAAIFKFAVMVTNFVVIRTIQEPGKGFLVIEIGEFFFHCSN